MKKNVFAAAAMVLTALFAAPAVAADYTTIILEKTVGRTPDQTWAKIGPYCAIATWLKVTCVVTVGNGVSVGSNRLLNGNNNEIMIAATPYSYSYTQPATTILYHGTLAVEPIDRGHSTARSSTRCSMTRHPWAPTRPRRRTGPAAPSGSARRWTP